MINNKVVRAVATVTIFSVFTRALSFIFKIYLSRVLGAEVMGLYQICISIFYLFAALSASGIPLVLSRKTAEARALNNKDDARSLFSSALLMGISISVATIVVLFTLKPYLGSLLADKRAAPLFIIMLPALLSTTIYSVIRSWFWGRKQFTYFSITETVEEVLRILFSVLFVSGVISGVSGAYGIAIAFTISDIVVAIILVIMFFTKGGRLSSPTQIKDIFKPALPITAMRVFGSLVATLIALMLPARLMAIGMPLAEATASYGRIAGMANPLIMAPNAIISSLTIVLIPEMSENGIRNDYSSLNRHINNGINFALIVCGIFMVVFFALGRELTTLLYNDSVSGEYLQLATWLMIPMSINQITSNAINSIGLERQGFVNYIFGTLFLIGAVYFLPKYIGIYAVAVATMLSLSTTSILNLYTLRKKSAMPMGFIKTLILLIIFIFPCTYFCETLNSILYRFMGQFSVLVSATFGGLMYCGLCVLSDLVDIRGFISRKKTKTMSTSSLKSFVW